MNAADPIGYPTTIAALKRFVQVGTRYQLVSGVNPEMNGIRRVVRVTSVGWFTVVDDGSDTREFFVKLPKADVTRFDASRVYVGGGAGSPATSLYSIDFDLDGYFVSEPK